MLLARLLPIVDDLYDSDYSQQLCTQTTSCMSAQPSSKVPGDDWFKVYEPIQPYVWGKPDGSVQQQGRQEDVEEELIRLDLCDQAAISALPNG